MEFKKETYKGIEISYEVNEKGMFSARALGILSTDNIEKDRDINHCYPSLERAEKDIKTRIDDFLCHTPKNFKELAESLTAHLTWTDYENCYLDEFVCKTIVVNFLKTNPSIK